MGDGDALAIGGNHFIHAARRNIDITAIVMNNRIYGMTGGQFSPLSGEGIQATTAPFANIDYSFDVVELSKAAGATFVARTTSYHVQQMTDIIKKAILHEGFSVVEVLSQCPTYFGRKNKAGDAVDMVKWFKNNTTPIGSKAKQENPDLIERGIFVQKDSPEYCNQYDKDRRTGDGGWGNRRYCKHGKTQDGIFGFGRAGSHNGRHYSRRSSRAVRKSECRAISVLRCCGTGRCYPDPISLYQTRR